MGARPGKIVNCLYQNPKAIFRLICFPWAGGGSIHFAKWGQTIHDSMEVHSIRLAGRESRYEEPFASDFFHVVDEIICALLPILQDKPFAFFGHSMGSYIAFMTAARLKERHQLEPMHLFVSSANAPHVSVRLPIPEDKDLTENRIYHFLATNGGTPQNLIDNSHLQEHVPVLMADINLMRSFIFEIQSEAVLSCDLTCFLGSEDELIKGAEAWKAVTSGSFDLHCLPGNHFYLIESSIENFIKEYITKCLELTTLC
ncbi:PREDICTED: S-acyl fatty acid synthase thioesterase, medium chain [Chrysochloris asiatica]|uniref:S-acyl fatty acid synthase thioesterase, medium chain n=1 Tax=Chrysochloris asiatica TaxID=185453 RepID=A0A9B0TXQ2_CHRAS|nr:PREDICTED: S-acyl fatty acid synthase thioesterase, medium chain [Chrysochloris asiatica]